MRGDLVDKASVPNARRVMRHAQNAAMVGFSGEDLVRVPRDIACKRHAVYPAQGSVAAFDNEQLRAHWLQHFDSGMHL